MIGQTREWEADWFGPGMHIQDFSVTNQHSSYFRSFPVFWSLGVSEMLPPDSLNREEGRKRFNWRVRMTEWAL